MPKSFVAANKCVTVEIDDGQIAWVTLNRPEKRNAISPALSDDMQEALDRVEHDENVKVVVLSGAGDSYSAGMDLKEFFRASDNLTPEKRAAFGRSSAWQWRRLRFFLKPTICMVNGWCFGAGFNSMIACDLAVAADEAQFGLSEINWGMIPAGNVLKNVCSVMNARDAMYYTITAETFDGKQAAAMGVVNESVPRAKLKERVTRGRQGARREERDGDASLQVRGQARERDVVGRRGRLFDGEARPDALPRHREGAREGHAPVPRREDLPARPREL